MPIHSRQKEDTVPKLIRRLLLAWLLAITLESLLLPAALRNLSGLEGLAKMSLPRACALTCGGFLLLEAADRLKKQKNAATYYKRRQRERWAISGLFLLDAALSLIASFTWAFLGACVLLMGILAHYARCGWNGTLPSAPAQRKESPVWLWLLVALTIAFCIFDSFWTIARIRSFSTPTYDFGIFSQMFYNMRKTGLPMTTLERDGLLSHFAVHVSPIWYLMLPFYWLVPKPETLQVLQAIILASSVIPFWKICKLYGLSAPTRFFLCAALLLYPSFSGGTSYDVHENCFLTPLILWLLYGIDRKRTGIAAVAAILTLCVKEDAAIYVAVIAIWLIVRSLLRKSQSERKSLWLGLVLLAGSILWFLAVTAWLAKAGDGVMTYRYSNFMYDGSDSLITVIKSVLLQPFKALYECVDAEKLSFLGLSLLPLLGLLLWTRRYERLLLLIPFVLVNLMSDYQYQHDIFFQYTFGSTACLFYLTAVNLEDWRPNWTKAAGGIAAAVLCAACFGFMVVPKAGTYFQKCTTYSAYYDQLREELSRIPKDASVSATTFYTTQLSQREILYDVKYASFEHLLETDYIVLAVSEKTNYTKYASSSADDGLDRLVKRLEKNGYEQISTRENVILIFRKKKPSEVPTDKTRLDEKETKESSPATDEPAEPATTESVQTEPAPTEPPVGFEEITAIDNDQCLLKITGLEEDKIWGYTLKVYLENRTSNKTLTYSVINGAVNGVSWDPFFATDVAAGKKKNDEISFSDDTLEKLLPEFTDIELALRVYDSNDWAADDVANEIIHILVIGFNQQNTRYRLMCLLWDIGHGILGA